MTKTLLVAGAIVAGLFSTYAHAANNRTWISGKGVDQAGCGPVATPCRTLQYAHDNTNAGGEINVLDPAGYGSLTITKAISVINDGVGTAGVLATAGTAIMINAGASDEVVLRGLTIEGANTANDGVSIGTVGTLTIANCAIQGFTKRGVLMSSPAGHAINIFNTTISDNRQGLSLSPTTGVTALDVVLDRVTVSGSTNLGFLMAGDSGTSGQVRLSISNSLFSSNNNKGLLIFSAAVAINAVITDSVFTANNMGIQVVGDVSSANVALGRNTIAHNATGVFISDSVVQSYSNNQFANNGADVVGSLTPLQQK